MKSCVLVVAAMAARMAAGECPHWISVMPLHADRIDELAADAADLAGALPGGFCYNGVGPATCLSGTAGEDGRVFVLNLLDLDGDDAPEFVFDEVPARIERLRGDGTWENVAFAADGRTVTLKTKVETQRPGIFRMKN